MPSSRPAAVKLFSRAAASKTISAPADGNRWRRLCISPSYATAKIFPASQIDGYKTSIRQCNGCAAPHPPAVLLLPASEEKEDGRNVGASLFPFTGRG